MKDLTTFEIRYRKDARGNFVRTADNNYIKFNSAVHTGTNVKVDRYSKYVKDRDYWVLCADQETNSPNGDIQVGSIVYHKLPVKKGDFVYITHLPLKKLESKFKLSIQSLVECEVTDVTRVSSQTSYLLSPSSLSMGSCIVLTRNCIVLSRAKDAVRKFVEYSEQR